VDAFSKPLLAIGKSTTWWKITRRLGRQRAGCYSPQLRAIPQSTAERQASADRQISRRDKETIATAMRILEEGTARSPGRAANTLEIRLALLTAHKYTRDAEPIRLLWKRLGNGGRTNKQGLSEPLISIRHRLEELGWLAPRVLAEPIKTWPTSSQTPPG
jgi:hypothetical protein